MTVPGPSSTAWIDEIAWSPSGPPWLAMGLSRIDEQAWLHPDHARDEQLALRHELLRERHDEVFGALAGTEAAGAELLDLVRSWERRWRPDLAGRPVDAGVHPLEAAGRRTQEDLVLMGRHPDGFHLDAAVLCFPSHWRLADKLGGSARSIHGPVPGYRQELASKVDRFFERLRAGVVVVRRNWSVHPDDTLFAPEAPDDAAVASPDEVPHRLWLRSERQTLRTLPATGSIAFTIRVQQAPLAALGSHPAAAAALARRLRAQPAALTEMNGLLPHREAVLTWLARGCPR